MPKLNIERTRELLQRFDFARLFIEELGWDRYSGALTVAIDGRTYPLRAFAEKRGVQIFECTADSGGTIPDYAIRRKIEKQLSKSAYEHLIIYTDASKTSQVWQWVLRQPGQPAAYREHHFYAVHHSGDALIRKLGSITFPLSAEEGLTLTGVVFALRDAFDRDRLTKRFYKDFEREHAAFLEFIQGITASTDREWYASLMLNRLMFVYFIQQKGFLDGDDRYLQNRLRMVQERKGKGKFHSFFRYFLLRLFHEGFAKQPTDRPKDLEDLLGEVPYLDGGLFEEHELELKYPGIDIPDEAFEKLFAFFDQWSWHLDERPLRNDREINPDVLGYIFEKYINQKQMGAYYTKEDITEYIGKNTIIPYLFDAAAKKCAIAFEAGSALWRLLREDPDGYLYEPVRRGVIDEKGDVIRESELPDFVHKGMHDPKARMFERRYNLGEANLRDAQGRKLTLPTETWREYVSRRERCLELREKLARGEINDVNDLITYNLDIRQFAEDVIGNCEGPELLRAFYRAITTVAVLDPTCGSGAFLFAALNILERLYEACLDRMQAFVDDLDRSGERHRPEKFSDFRKVLAEIDKRPSRRYFILKSIIVNNLYGVDIMEEAVEICKLRLFLKLVAQVDSVKDLEPLPDIDFNIRPGNTLVGFVSLDEIRRAAQRETEGQERIVFGETEDAIRRIEEDAEIVDRAFRRFHQMQTTYGMDAKEFASAKRELRERLKTLAAELDQYLAGEYGIDVEKKSTFEAWRASHQPFHWFAEFYGIMQRGGFDVIIGNPPYIELKEMTQYVLRGYGCESAGNLYALVMERCFALCPQKGQLGFIVPVSSVSTERYQSLQSLLTGRRLHYSSFDDRPSRLFDGLEHIRLTIHVFGEHLGKPSLSSTRYKKWMAVERPQLFNTLQYEAAAAAFVEGSLPKLSSELEHGIIKKLGKQTRQLAYFYSRTGNQLVFYSRKVGYFLQILDFQPLVLDGHGRRRPPSEFKDLSFASEPHAKLALSCLNSNLFYWFITVYSDCRHVNKREVDAFPIDLQSLTEGPHRAELTQFSAKLMKDLDAKSKASTMTFKHDTLTVQCIIPKRSKPIIDEIDRVLARHYGFTDEELDFIINYDIKYRMGGDAVAGGEK